MFISGCEELSLEEYGGWQWNLTVQLPGDSLFPFLLPSLPSSVPALLVSCEREVPKHLRGGSTPSWGLMSLQEHSRRVSPVSENFPKPGTAMTPSGGSGLSLPSL